MAKSDNEKLAERLEEIQELLKKKGDIEDRLKYLTGIKHEEKKANGQKPEGFSLMDAIKNVLQERDTPLTSTAINSAIALKYSYNPTLTTTRSTAKYMVKKGILKANADKTFCMKEKTPTLEELGL